MAEFNYRKVDINIIDEQGHYEEDKDTKVTLRYDSNKGCFTAATPIVKKVDRTPNESIFESEHFSFAIKVHKDSRLGPSGKISKQNVEKLGAAAVEAEFAKAARAICKHFGVIE